MEYHSREGGDGLSAVEPSQRAAFLPPLLDDEYAEGLMADADWLAYRRFRDLGVSVLGSILLVTEAVPFERVQGLVLLGCPPHLAAEIAR